MRALVQGAYIAALALWIPLAVVAALQPPARRRVMVPLLASAIAAAYEAYMSLVWSQTVSNPIRVDILLVMFALGIVDAMAGFSLLAGGRGRRDPKPLKLAGTLCLAVPALVIAGFVAMSVDTAGVDRNLDLARRFRFEAYFRSDETEKRVFGELEPDKNPWAGYYAGIGDDDRFAHLVVNDEGGFWIYHSQLYEYRGNGRQGPGADDAFEGVGESRMNSRMRMALRRQGNGPFLLEVDFGDTLNSPAPRPVRMRKADPPRFPRPSFARNEVRFAGVFSGTYGELDNNFWLAQVWLWESDGEWWGQYLRDSYTRGSVRDFISTEAVAPACSAPCTVLSFKTSRGPVTLARVSDDEFKATLQGEREAVALTRGETLPGFFLDLAPLATKAENRRWIDALTTANMIAWKASLAEQAPRLVRRDPSPWFDLESELNQRGVKTDSASLIEIARSNADVGTRWTAMEILGLRKEEKAKPVLERILEQSNEPLLKETAALAIARLGYARGVNNLEALMRGSTNAERQIFMAARLAELEFGNASGYTYVALAATGSDPQLQYLSAGALVPFLRHETGSGIDPTNRFLNLLQNEDPRIRKEVLAHVPVAIAQGLSAEKVRPILARLATGDRDESVRETARLMLLSLRKEP